MLLPLSPLPARPQPELQPDPAASPPEPVSASLPLSQRSSALDRALRRLPGPRHTFVDRLHRKLLLRHIASDPKHSALWLVLFTLAYLCVAGLFELLGWWALVFVLLAVWRGVYELARSIVWPGQLKLFARKVERTAAADVHKHVLAVAGDTEAAASSLALSPADPGLRIARITEKAVHLVEPLAASASALIDDQSPEAGQRLRDALVEFREARVALSHSASLGGEHVAGAARRLVAASVALRYTAHALMDVAESLGGDAFVPANHGNKTSDLDSESEEQADEEQGPGGEGHGLHSSKGTKAMVWLPQRAWQGFTEQVAGYFKARRKFTGAASFALYRTHLLQMRQGVRERVRSRDGTHIDAMWLPCKSPVAAAALLQPPPLEPPQAEDRRRVVILCNPNAAVFELLALHPFWVDYYHARGCDVVAWNYRGYGESEGSVTPLGIREDIEALVARFGAGGEAMVGLHGESIGGVAACHGASLPQVSLVVCDRTFASLDAMALALVGPVVARVFRGATRWEADNVRGFAQAAGKTKIILQDFEDRIVPHGASLKAGVARRAFGAVCEEAKLCHALAVLIMVCARNHQHLDLGEKVKVPSPVHPERMVEVLLPAAPSHEERAFVTQYMARVLALEGGHGPCFGLALGVELAGKRGAVGDWFACAQAWGNAAVDASAHVPASVREEFRACVHTVQSEFAKLRHDPDQLPLCGLVPLTCGHNGVPSRAELRMLDACLAKW